MEEQIIRLQEDGKAPDKVECHLMPCRIDHTGRTIKSKEYFHPTIRKLKAGGDNDQGRTQNTTDTYEERFDSAINPILLASFRGRPLQGREIQLPRSYKGYLVCKEKNGNKKSLKSFDEFTYWNWDEIPSNDDTVVKALQWINISNALHDNLEEVDNK